VHGRKVRPSKFKIQMVPEVCYYALLQYSTITVPFLLHCTRLQRLRVNYSWYRARGPVQSIRTRSVLASLFKLISVKIYTYRDHCSAETIRKPTFAKQNGYQVSHEVLVITVVNLDATGWQMFANTYIFEGNIIVYPF